MSGIIGKAKLNVPSRAVIPSTNELSLCCRTCAAERESGGLGRFNGRVRGWFSVPPERRFKAGHSAISGVVVGRTAPARERSRDRAKTAA